MTIRSFAAIALVGITFNSFAQGDFRPGYIIKNNGDSIAGLVNYRSKNTNSESCVFKDNKKAVKKRFIPSELKAYGFVGDRHYESKIINYGSKPDYSAFVETLIKGKINLHLHRGVFYFEKDSLIMLPNSEFVKIQTDSGEYVKKKSRYVEILNMQLTDCNLSANNVRYNQKDLTNLIKNYNRCKGSSSVVYKENLAWAKFNFQVFTGLVFSNLEVDGYPNNTFNTSSTVIGGGGIDFSSPRLSHKIFFSAEAWYVDNVYQGYAEEKRAYTLRTDITLKSSFLKIPIGFRYNFFSEDQTPYLKFGFVQYFKLASTLRLVQESVLKDVVYVAYTNEEYEGKNQQGFWFAAGYTKGLKNRFKVFSEFRYERTNGFIGSVVESTSSITNYQILLGLRF